MADVNGKICLITGGTNGIGKAAAAALAKLGAQVVIVGRNAERCAATVSEIRAQTGNPSVEALIADLSSMAEVRRVAAEFKAKHDRLHVLVNNAGAIFFERKLSVDGYEVTFALNHLAYFLLTNLLLDTLKASAPARVITVSSDAHKTFAVDLNDLQNTRFSGFRSYGRSKAMNVMFAYELARRLEGTGVTSNVLHPGVIRSGFGKNNSRLLIQIFNFFQRFGKTPEEGAETIVYLASAPEVEGVTGKYWDKKQAVSSAKATYDKTAWRRLWEASEKLINNEQSTELAGLAEGSQ